jgi:hypothetical protein
MKAKPFKIVLPEIKARKQTAPASKAHKDKKNNYNRQVFKNGGFEL